jgi:glycosyltransferase involved in cell wall biosynthesis
MMKIALITGSYPPDADGIGDYTSQLVHSLIQQGVTVEVIHRTNWRLSNMGSIIKSIRACNPDIVHMQYPTAGYGRRLTPQLLSLLIPSVVTVHEASEAHILRKLSLYPFTLRSRHIIFTTPYEQHFVVRRAPWISQRCNVIPVGSSIRTGQFERNRNLTEVVYFGFFRPQKGLEEVFTLAELVKQKGLPFSVRLIGKPFPVDSPYFKELYRRSEKLPIKWDIDLAEDVVADLLSGVSMGYMPYPDGASGRRTSLLALLANGVATITTRGAHTPSSLDQAVLFTQDTGQALQLIEKIRSDDVLRNRLSENGRTYASQFRWDAIAKKHLELYENLLA